MSDLTDILQDPDFRTGDPVYGYVVTRQAAPTVFTDGVATAGVTSQFTTGPAILRPLRGRDLQALPEGYHANDTRKLITTAELLAGPPPDVVTIAGESGADEAWTVLSVATTTAFGGTHRMVMLGRGPLP